MDTELMVKALLSKFSKNQQQIASSLKLQEIAWSESLPSKNVLKNAIVYLAHYFCERFLFFFLLSIGKKLIIVPTGRTKRRTGSNKS